MCEAGKKGKINMSHWGKDESDPSFVANADRIVAALRMQNGPLWEKDLRKAANVRSIGAYFRYLASRHGVVRISDEWNRPDDDNKMYVLSRFVCCVDQEGHETTLNCLYTFRP